MWIKRGNPVILWRALSLIKSGRVLTLILTPQVLYEEWASYSIFYKYQPIGLIKYVSESAIS